jgi:hypothetical protein
MPCLLTEPAPAVALIALPHSALSATTSDSKPPSWFAVKGLGERHLESDSVWFIALIGQRANR